MRTKKPNLTPELKTKAAQLLMQHQKNGKLTKGKVKETAALLGISRGSVTNIWAETSSKLKKGEAVIFKSTQWSKHKDRAKLDAARMKAIPIKKRTTIRSLAKEMDMSKSVLGRWIKSGEIRAHTSAVKPVLTAENKLLRLRFSLSSLLYDRALHAVKFKPLHNTVHIDEKWFYIKKECERYYLVPGEEEPYRSCKSKRYITKLMFMCAVSRPIFSSSGEVLFDGKIGIFPFTEKVPAMRNSKNRAKGTLETKPIEAITKVVIKNCIINQIIPSIKSKWPPNASKDIFIQQDNAKPHIANNDTEFRAAASSDGFNIHLVCQPPNSPDTNINDLGFFRAIEGLQVQTASYKVDDIVVNVMNAYEELPAMTLNKVFVSLQACMIEIIKCKGHNSFKVPHMQKDKLIREGRLPNCLQVDDVLIKEAIDYLRLPGNDIVSTYDVDTLVKDLMWLA